MNGQTNKWADRRTDIQTDGRTDKLTNRQILTGRHTEKQDSERDFFIRRHF